MLVGSISGPGAGVAVGAFHRRGHRNAKPARNGLKRTTTAPLLASALNRASATGRRPSALPRSASGSPRARPWRPRGGPGMTVTQRRARPTGRAAAGARAAGMSAILDTAVQHGRGPGYFLECKSTTIKNVPRARPVPSSPAGEPVRRVLAAPCARYLLSLSSVTSAHSGSKRRGPRPGSLVLGTLLRTRSLRFCSLALCTK
jgi:hypothetical protein